MLEIFAVVLFFVNATAVQIGPLRLSDWAFLMLSVLTIARFANIQRLSLSFFSRAFSILTLIVFSTVLSWFSQLFSLDNETIEAGYANALIIPATIIVSMAFLSTMDQLKIEIFISKISLVFSLMFAASLISHLISPNPEWLNVDYGATDRFSALSSNPNQLALVLLPLPFFSYISWRNKIKSGAMATAEIVTIFVINFYCFGKALFIAWFIGFSPAIYFEFVSKKGNIRILLLVALFVLSPLLIYEMVNIFESFYNGTAAGSIKGQGENRLVLWEHGLEAWSDAIFLGNGPGAFSGTFAARMQQEAHNIFIDWGASYGLIGFLLLLYFYISALSKSIAARDWAITGLFVALSIQAMFHFYGRQPFFWLWWLIGLGLLNSVPKRQSAAPERVAFGRLAR